MVAPENPRYISDVRYTADRETVDSLKAAISDLSPAQELEVRRLGVIIEGRLQGLYQTYIPSHRIEELSGIADRILVTNKTMFHRFMSAWSKHARSSDATIGTVYREGSIIHLVNTRRVWNMMPESFQQEFSQQISDQPSAAQDIFAEMLLVNNLAHEMAHVYQYPILPRAFTECGARYYSRAISQDLGMPYLYVDLDEERIAFYETLINRFGEGVHGVFFGSETNYKRASTILAEATEEIDKRLFS